MRAELFQGAPAAATTARDLERALLGLQSIAAGAGAIVERYNVDEQSEEIDFAARLLRDLVGLMSDFYEKIEPTVQSGRVDVVATGTHE